MTFQSSINWTNVTSGNQLFDIPNQSTNGGFWVSVLYMIWVVLILVFLYWGFETALIVSSFLCLMFAVFLTYAGFIAWTYCLFFLGIILFMVTYIIWSSYR